MWVPMISMFLMVLVASSAGYYMGLQRATFEEDAEAEGLEAESKQPESRLRQQEKSEKQSARKRSGRNKRPFMPRGREVGAPAVGSVERYFEGGHAGAMIHTTQGKVFAPVAGKITRIYPMGNAMVLQADYGVEFVIQAGKPTDELQADYFRPRVIRNEVVGKGKLLLEYDREALLKENVDTAVYISVADAVPEQAVTLTEDANVKVGEKLFWVQHAGT